MNNQAQGSHSMDLQTRIQAALKEDCPGDDVTSEVMVPPQANGTALIRCKGTGVVAGRLIWHTFAGLYPDMTWGCDLDDGTPVQPGDVWGRVTGPLRQLLHCERVFLNLLGKMAGIATATRQLVDALSDPAIAVLDTRKTTPLWRDIERMAVRTGGGVNHRLNLSDMILIKENHLIAHDRMGLSLADTIRHATQRYPGVSIMLEIESIQQARTLALDGIHMMMLDNMVPATIREVVGVIRDRGFEGELEVSGGVTLDTISLYRGLPIQRISVGSMTHSAPVLDISMRVLHD